MPYKFSAIVDGDSSPQVHQRVQGDEIEVERLLKKAKITNCPVDAIGEYLTVGEEWVKNNPRDAVFISNSLLYYANLHPLGCKWSAIPIPHGVELEEACEEMKEYYQPLLKG